MTLTDLSTSSKVSIKIKVILFDVNGTLRVREPHDATQLAARQRILAILGKAEAGDDFWLQLEARYKAYGAWAGEHLVQLSEAEIWTHWMLPDEPKEKLAPHVSELMLAWSERKGRVVPKSETEPVLAELQQRGYRLGLISNTMSTLDIPGFVEHHGWQKYFGVVLLSAFEKSRKPSPELFLRAANRLGCKPEECAYVGNRYLKDIVGCKNAGFALGIMLLDPVKPLPTDQAPDDKPDLVIDSLNRLLDYFPEISKQN